MTRIQSAQRAAILTGASAIVLGLACAAAPALAQDATSGAPPSSIGPTPTRETSDGALDEVVVTARRKALESATLRKIQSDTIIDSVVADEAGKLPDTSITEVLQRIPGVTIDRFANLASPDQFAWEGTGIQVRGLSGVTGLLNGEEVFSANGGSGLNFNEVTPELLSAVDVYKDSIPDMIESGLAGTVDLHTHMPFDYNKPTFEGTVSDSYGDMARKSAPSGSFMVTDRWDTPIGQIGALLDVAHTEYDSGDSFIRTEPYYNSGTLAAPKYIPGGFDYGEDGFDRTRTGVYEALQWKPNSELTLWQTAFYSNYKQTNTGGGVFSDSNADSVATNAVFNSQNVFQSGTVHAQGWTPTNPVTFAPGNANQYTPSNNSTADFSQGFIWQPSHNLKVSGAFQYVNSGAYAGSFGLGVGGINLTSETLDLSPDGKLPQDAITNGAALLASKTATVGSIIWNTTNNDADMKAVHVDVEYKFEDDSFFKSVKFGARYADRHETDNFEGSYWSALNESWDGHQINIAQSPASDFTLYQFPNFFKGSLAAPAPSYWFANANTNRAGDFNSDIKTFGAGEYPKGTSYETLGTPTITNTAYDTTAAYFKVAFGSAHGLFGVPFTGNFGVRVVENQITSSGNFAASQSTCFYLNTAGAATGLAAAGGLAAAQATKAPNASSCYLPDTYQLAAFTGSRQGSFNYVRALPSLNVNFKPTSQWIVRLAVNQTMTPANFSDLRASGGVGTQTLTNNPANVGLAPGVQGLPGIFNGYSYNSGVTNLRPEISTNEDLSIEWYPNKSLSAHLDFFNKDIKDQLIYNSVNFTESFPLLAAGSSTAITNIALPVQGQQDENASKTATIYGFEAGFRDFFDFLPGPLSGLGVEANYTDVESKSPSSYGLDVNGAPITDLPVVALSHSAYNVSLLYDKGPWDARLAWSWRSRYLATTTGNGTSGTYTLNGAATATTYALPVYGAAFGSLDGSVSYKVNDHLKLQASAANMTNTIARTEMEILRGVFENRSWFISDRRYELAAHLSF
jgi:iron complex outermembrane receptor protein